MFHFFEKIHVNNYYISAVKFPSILVSPEGREQLLNLNCWIINFVHCLKEKCGLDLEGIYNSFLFFSIRLISNTRIKLHFWKNVACLFCKTNYHDNDVRGSLLVVRVLLCGC